MERAECEGPWDGPMDFHVQEGRLGVQKSLDFLSRHGPIHFQIELREDVFPSGAAEGMDGGGRGPNSVALDARARERDHAFV